MSPRRPGGLWTGQAGSPVGSTPSTLCERSAVDNSIKLFQTEAEPLTRPQSSAGIGRMLPRRTECKQPGRRAAPVVEKAAGPAVRVGAAGHHCA